MPDASDTTAATTPTAEDAGWDVITAGVQRAQSLLGTRLLAAYALGSLAQGGFAPEVSDVDLALIVGSMRTDPEPICRAIRERVAAH